MPTGLIARKHRTKKRENSNTVIPSSCYTLGYFTLWWSRMYHEGVKEAATKKIQAENKASSARIRDYLMCGKKTVPEKSSYDTNFVDKQ